MSGPSTFPEPERQAGGLLCCIPARPGVLGTTFLGMFFSGVLTSMLWIEVANARGFIPVAKAALISSGVVSCATFIVCFLGLIATVARRFDVLRVYMYAACATLLLQSGFFPWLVYQVVVGTDPAFAGIPLLKVCRHTISVDQQTQCGSLLRDTQSVIYTFVGLAWFTQVESAIVVARYVLLLNRERRREAQRQPVIFTRERNISHTRVDSSQVRPEQQLLMPQPEVHHEFDPYAEVGHSMPQSAHPGFAPEPVSSIPRYAAVPTDDMHRNHLPPGAMGAAYGRSSQSTPPAQRSQHSATPPKGNDAAPTFPVAQTTPEPAQAVLYQDSPNSSGSFVQSMPIANNATPPSIGHRPKDTPTLLERRLSRPLPPLPPSEFPHPSTSTPSPPSVHHLSITRPSYSPPPALYRDPPPGAPRPLPSSYPLPPPQYSAQLAAYASQLSPLPSSPTEDTRRSGYTWETQTPSSETHSGSSTETAAAEMNHRLVREEQLRAWEEQQRAWEEQRRAWGDGITEVARSREEMSAQGEEETTPRWRTGPEISPTTPQATSAGLEPTNTPDTLGEPPRPLLRVRTPPAPRPLSIVHEERSDDAMTARYVEGP
ncbi:hypothetical protein EV715DRAFT_252179 [Schizophyllum commune]